MYYQVPLYRELAQCPQIDFTAIFASTAGLRPHDAGYGQLITWDVDLLDGYRSIFLKRASKNEIMRASFFNLRDFDVLHQLRAGRFEVLWVHGYNSLTHQLAILYQLFTSRPLLIREEQTLLDHRPIWKRALKTLVLPAEFGRASGLYIGSRNRDWFRRYGVRPDHLFHVPYVADNQQLSNDFSRLRSNRSVIRSDFGISADAGPVIVSVARLVDKKQPLFLLEAFRRVRERHRCALLLVGSGDLEGAVRKHVAEERIPDVHLSGFLNRSQISRAYGAADIFALVSKAQETWGMAVNEAMTFSLPVVVTDNVGCSVDLVRPGLNGYVVSSGDPGDLAVRLSELVLSPALRTRLGQASVDVISSWTYEAALRGLLEAIKVSVGERRWRAATTSVGETEPETQVLPIGQNIGR